MTKEQQIEEMMKVIFDYVDSKTDKDKIGTIHIMNSAIDEEIKPLSHNKGIAEALYNAGYRLEITLICDYFAAVQKQAIKVFAEKLKAKCNDNGDWESDDSNINNEFFNPGKISIDDIDQVLKEYDK